MIVEQTSDAPPARLFGRLCANRAGVKEAFFAFAAGLVLSSVVVAVVTAGRSDRGGRGIATDVADLITLYLCYLGAVAVTYRKAGFGNRITRSGLADAFGVSIRPLDVPLGIVMGFAAQFVVVPVASLPLVPFVPHLTSRLSGVAHNLTDGISTPGLVILGVFICLASPMLEELFFRGVLLRGLAGSTGLAGLVRPRVALVAALSSSILFGLAHFELLQLLGLAATGFCFAGLAASTGRLGAGFVAHVTFNTLAFVSVTHAL